jgi:hypothetical protein
MVKSGAPKIYLIGVLLFTNNKSPSWILNGSGIFLAKKKKNDNAKSNIR